ncbi:nitroreductase family deazaflavin-dependent oxidoreductase [Promicromonospora sp. NPDC023805]|uniref:nitroreductase family deazaflavin-dependent oxidoreductase n=1 Tax=Promicromonospora sp. NPDC023805 TaxID=3154696 RepID=UPI0033D7A2C4
MNDTTESPDPSVAEHVRRYLDTDGASGHLEAGVTNLLLTHRGRKTGRLHRTALFYGQDGDRHVLVASGSVVTATHPQWYLNLVEHPEAEIQVLARRFAVRARTAEGAERARLWELMVQLAPVYRAYAARSPRVIPVVVLEEVGPAV